MLQEENLLQGRELLGSSEQEQGRELGQEREGESKRARTRGKLAARKALAARARGRELAKDYKRKELPSWEGRELGEFREFS